MKIFKFPSAILLLLLSNTLSAQKQDQVASTKPKLVVGIIVDQMRNDFIYRYWERYGEGGFKRLVNEGFYFKNTHFNYIPTYTGPGHCSIYTGTTPRTHGIIANDWCSLEDGSEIYCVWDTAAKTVGSASKAGWMSPKNQLSSTIGDELMMSSNGRAKVIGIALKDRSAILAAGHLANAAFWFEDVSGNFITSNWYQKELPQWLTEFNSQKLAAKYLGNTWNTLYPINSYSNSIDDDNNYENAAGKKKPVFPYQYKNYLEKNQYGIIKATPFGNSLTKDLALACIKNEGLGKDEICDLFCISFSSTDIIAHSYGPRSVEVEDIYLRLDKDLAEILETLDNTVGKNNYTVFLTADHGGADVPKHLMDKKIPAGYIYEKNLMKKVRNYFYEQYNDSSLLSNINNEQIFINGTKLRELKLDKDQVEEKLAAFMTSVPGIAEAYPSKVLRNGNYEKNDYRALLQNGYNHKLSGNVCFIYHPAWMDYAEKGTTHGAGYNYDTHVPLIFYGSGIPKGYSYSYTAITQIAPSICELIKINQPNSCTSEPLNNHFR